MKNSKKRFNIEYSTKSGEISRTWIMADNITQAEREARNEYSDVNKILKIYPAK